MLFSALSLNSPIHVFIFIIVCSVFVCSILWIYGDAATRGLAGWKGSMLPVLLIAIGLSASSLNLAILLLWPIAFVAWFFLRPATVRNGDAG